MIISNRLFLKQQVLAKISGKGETPIFIPQTDTNTKFIAHRNKDRNGKKRLLSSLMFHFFIPIPFDSKFRDSIRANDFVFDVEVPFSKSFGIMLCLTHQTRSFSEYFSCFAIKGMLT